MVQINSFDSDNLLKSLGCNWIIMGPAGSGKTTTAELCGTFLYYMGIYVDEPITVQKKDFVSAYGGGSTLSKTNATLLKSLGRLMIIDEAYNIFVEGNGKPHEYSNDIADVFLTFMTKNMGRSSLVAVGYEDSMLKYFLKANSGFTSRFPYQETIKSIDLTKLKEILVKEIKESVKISDIKFTVKADNFLNFLIKHNFFTSFVRDIRYFISSLVSYVVSLLLSDTQVLETVGILFMYNVMKKYCMNPVCKESFKNVLPPLPELIELPYLMNEQKKTEQDQGKIKNVTERLEQNYKGYIIDKVFIIKNETKKYAYTIKHDETSKEGMVIPWEFSTDVRDNSKSTQDYIIVDNVTTVF